MTVCENYFQYAWQRDKTEQVLIYQDDSKDGCGDYQVPGSIKYGTHYGLSTKTVDIQFELTRHFIPELRNGDTGSENTKTPSQSFVATWTNKMRLKRYE